ncbi:O-acetyl-ADP-ribose deacetylase [Flaviflexus ciconiae]|uniref:O-acetyl-ADP-ribose deacetylase n=1 Tax=Flaviflexus ciconiae TaxID=2496867 RepID=A0A3Q9G914_9ACTO|nr:O-acetyl-ADP-ribose deacetylase [Flaviflexus ciconiae]AZQ77939.1 O-acetyl-ADP-ribose deacetylase [Flaviflexus ciconiae]
MAQIEIVRADITTLDVDAVVNAANNRMRGGGGVDGAIHRAGGPEILEDCIKRFPDGLATGDAGWTTGGKMPSTWVIHAVGPNYSAGQTDRSLLASCYRRSLEVADELGVKSIAFPIISAGVYGWPVEDAAAAALETTSAQETDVEKIVFAAFSDDMVNVLRSEAEKLGLTVE